MAERACTKCGYTGDNFHPSYGTRCKPCLAQWQREYRTTQHGYAAAKRTQRRSVMRKRYGITPEQYEAMKEAQGSRCAICGIPSSDLIGTPRHRQLQIDHDHSTGRVRGLVCNGCNRALGYISNNSAVARRMAQYLDMIHDERERRKETK